MGAGTTQRDAFAVEDAFALRVELAIASEHPALDPRLLPFLDAVRRSLAQVVDEAGLGAALAGLAPVLETLTGWPESTSPWPVDAWSGSARRGRVAWEDLRLLRFDAVLNLLWALGRGPEDPCGRRFARTALELGRRTGLGGERPPRSAFRRGRTIVNRVPGDAVEVMSGARRSRAAALARPAAARIAALLGAAPGGLTAQEVADALGLHHTGVRSRLARLERLGVVEGRVDPPAGRGRPPRRFVLTPDPAEREAAGHRELVRLLMSVVRESGFGPADVERFGERQGGVLVLPAGGPAEVTAAFARLGFAPREVGRPPAPDVVLDRCPFIDGVEAPGGELICVLHRGLARGMVREAAPGVEVVGLDVRDPRRAGCRLRMAVRRGDGGTGVRRGAGRDRSA